MVILQASVVVEDPAANTIQVSVNEGGISDAQTEKLALLGQTCMVSKSGISIPNSTNTTINNWTADNDLNGWLDVDGFVHAPVSGFYLQSARFDFWGIAYYKRSVIYLADGIIEDTGAGSPNGYTGFKHNVSGVCRLNAGETANLTIWTNGGPLSSCSARMTLTYLGPM
jgi:hypothetical protein